MNKLAPFITIIFSISVAIISAEEKPYITTQTPLTLFSTQDGETEAIWPFSTVKPYDYKLLAKDSFTVIHLGPDHPPIVKTVYGTIAATILGTPTMAMSKDGRYGISTNHSFRIEGSPLDMLTYPKDEPLTNKDIDDELLKKQTLSPQLSNMIQVVDLYDLNHKVVDRVLINDGPKHILSHPDGERFFAIANEHFFTYKLENAKLVELARSKIAFGRGCFWIHPDGNHILAGRSPKLPGKPAIPIWYRIEGDKVKKICDIEISKDVDVEYKDSGVILRITPDGKRGFICQRTFNNGQDLCDVLIVDLTMDKPMVTRVIKQVGDGLESFAFHPNGKMAVVTCLAPQKNAIAVLDIESDPPRLLYHIDASGGSQGLEFTPEGDKLFHGSPAHGRIEVYDVVGDFEIVKNKKFIKIGYGHNSLTMGPRYFPKKGK
mgnify:CR=1 FL=1|tara:strand:+ start:571 stop:1866 length:1296 start_codon:yes stop_codon:yes gene_type:complete